MNEKILLQDLVVLLAKEAGITQKDADRFYREMVQLILDRIYENDIVKIKNFGTFKLVEIRSRESVDVNTGKKIEISAHHRLSFIPDPSLKELINKPFSQFETVLLDDENKDMPDTKDLDLPNTKLESKLQTNDLDISKKEYPRKQINDITPSETKPRTKTRSYIPLISADEISEISKTIFEKKTEISEIPRLKAKLQASSVQEEKSISSIKENTKLDIINPIRTSRSLLKENPEKTNTPPVDKIEEKKTGAPSVENKVSELVTEAPATTPIVTKTPSGSSNVIPDQKVILDIEEADTTDKIEVEPPVVTPGVEIRGDEADKEVDEYQYEYESYENKSLKDKLKNKIPFILISLVVAVFAIYQFAKLFDVTYDYEYYIKKNQSLAMTDTLPYLMENNSKVKVLDSIKSDKDSSSVKSQKNKLATENELTKKPNPSSINNTSTCHDDDILVKQTTDLDSLMRKLESKDKVAIKSLKISDNFQINVLNKAEIYLTRTSKAK